MTAVTVPPGSPPYEYAHTQRLALCSELQRGTKMIRKLILAVTAAVALGSVTLVATDDASARGFGGGGFHRGGGGGGMRMGGGGGMRMGGGGGFRHSSSGGHRGGWGGNHGHWGHHQHWGHNRYWGHRNYGYGYRYGSYAPSYSAPVYAAAPVYSAPAYSAPAPAYSAPSAPVCQSCGGWTEDGGYMAYRKVTNEQTGQPELRCVKILDEQQQSSAGPIPYPGPQQQASAAPIPYPGR